ncbi:hypothetical protein NC652_022536 [Populus alba x Populus x berolinensis]|nr:hypothetical protein NC652_022536 [Populus alba x Populus x berolinensis]
MLESNLKIEQGGSRHLGDEEEAKCKLNEVQMEPVRTQTALSMMASSIRIKCGCHWRTVRT